MAPSSFLDKFTPAWQRPGSQSELAQVRQNLESVLNTKEGFGYFVQGFGVGNYLEKLGTRQLMTTLNDELLHAVVRFEPRLREPELKLRGRDSGLWLHFVLTGELNGEPCSLRLLFHTVSGRVRVEEEEEEG
ncbi:GPW/gp25 family protein [Archangium violaceum]|uniref:GPW/gp25 family protein n=1 Tax=Archangium violaceum TaxID=83451 RepID=UPI0036D8ABBE